MKLLIDSIENLDIEKLKTLLYFFGNLDNILDAKTVPKKWLYEKAGYHRRLKRALDKLRENSGKSSNITQHLRRWIETYFEFTHL
ncbi:MAG: hypothetical protein ACP5IA_07145 [Sediminispirochaetaceae bacterium]